MSRVTYFQRFSQKENHATNNTLLVLRHFYQASPFKIERALTSLVDEELSIGLTFEQQIVSERSVPDALIRQEAFGIYIEAKVGPHLDGDQIKRHIESISPQKPNAETSGRVILLGLTTEPITTNDQKKYAELAQSQGVQFGAITFSQIVEALRAQCADYERALIEILDDYEAYLAEQGLLEQRNQRMPVFPCGVSLAENESLGLYYESPSRPCKRNSRYIGAYASKAVRLVGVVETIVICQYQEGNLVMVKDGLEAGKFTEEQQRRVLAAMETTTYYDLKKDPLRFYLVDRFVPTEVKKTTPNGLMGMRYLDLSQVAPGKFDARKEYTAEELAALLNDCTFE